jgi:putative tryptophan/tyrosine transport system substrate-binding protein
VKRRTFITLLGGVATLPLAARAQEATSTIRRVGFLLPGVARTTAVRGLLEAFREGLKEYGWVEGQNISIDYRFAEGKEDALPGIAAELVRSRLDVIVAEGTAATRAAKTVTQTIPIVMATSADPVGTGLVASLNRPGGNITGRSLQTAELSGKRLELLTEIVPGFARLAVLSNPLNPSIASIVEQTKAAAQSLGIETHVVEVQAPDKFQSAFAAVTTARAGALIVLPDPLLYGQHPRIVTFTAASHLPALFPEKEVAEAGGLIAYGPSIPASFRGAAAYVDKSPWRQACRFASRTANQIRARRKSPDCQSDWRHNSNVDIAARRRGDRVKRREFITLLGGAAVAWPLAAHSAAEDRCTAGFRYSRGIRRGARQ